MKKYTYIITVFMFLGIVSCSKELEEENVPIATSAYYNTAAGYQDALSASYALLRNFYASGEDGAALTVFGTDEFMQGRGGNRKYFDAYTTAFNPSEPRIIGKWRDIYRGINSANTVLSRAETVQGLAQEDIDVIVAEARFLRAHNYFLLVQLFGDVPLRTEESSGVSTESKRATVSEVYDLIIGDLDQAVSNLPPSQSDWGRATRYAALHLRARAHLTRATMDPSADSNAEYTAARDDAEAVITSGEFQLLDDFSSVFEQGSGEINDEVIWSIQYSTDELTGGANNLHLYFLMGYDNLQQMVRDIENGRPFRRYKPTDYTLSLFDRNIDSRYDKSFKTVFFCNNPGTYNIVTTLQNTTVNLAVGDTAIWLPGRELPPVEMATKNFQVITPSQYDSSLYPTLAKFLDPNRLSVTQAAGSRDFIFARLAETYLISAEANFMLGNTDDAVDRINDVRTRAAYDGMETAMEITAGDIDMDFILEEYSRELLGEMRRWFDLVRTGTLVERVRLHNPFGGPNIQDFHVLRPIPQAHIDLVINEDGTPFQQNPGY